MNWNEAGFYIKCPSTSEKLSSEKIIKDVEAYIKDGGIVDVLPTVSCPQVKPKAFPAIETGIYPSSIGEWDNEFFLLVSP